MDGVAAGKSAVHGGKDLKPKVSNTNLAASGVLGQRRANAGVNVKAEPAVKAGAKRPALGNISNSGVKVSRSPIRFHPILIQLFPYRIPMWTLTFP
jgi:hypothetical protein